MLRYLAKFATLRRRFTAVATRGVVKIAKPIFCASVVIFAGFKPLITVVGTYGNSFQSTVFNMPFDKAGFTLPETLFVFYVPFTCLYEEKKNTQGDYRSNVKWIRTR